MKKILIAAAAAGVLAATLPALAQQPKAPDTKAPPAAAPAPATTPPAVKPPEAAKPAVKPVAIPPNTFFRGQSASQTLARDRFVGQNVYDKAGQKLGDIEDLILEGDRVIGVIVGVGGFLGVGEKKIGVRISALSATTKDGKRTLTLDASKEVLAQLQPYQRLEPQKTAFEKAKEAARVAAEKAKEAAKAAAEKTKAAVDRAKEKAKPAEPAKAPEPAKKP